MPGLLLLPGIGVDTCRALFGLSGFALVATCRALFGFELVGSFVIMALQICPCETLFCHGF